MDKYFNDIKSYIIGTDFFYKYNNDKFKYPIDLEFTLKNSGFYYELFDKDGVPIKNYVSVGKQYNPTRIAAYALAHFNRYTENNNQESKYIFLKMANWFLNISSAIYEYNFDWEDLKAPWISCMAQGEAVSVLIRAYLVTKESKYLLHAEKSLYPFTINNEAGGVQSKIDGKWLFLEEYPGYKTTHVLNGFLYALIGLIEYLKVNKNKKYEILRDELLISLEKNIESWGKGKWSFYQIDKNKSIKNYCTPFYHNLHITQLKFINDSFPNSMLKSTINRWEKGKNNLMVRLKAMFFKVIYRIKNKASR